MRYAARILLIAVFVLPPAARCLAADYPLRQWKTWQQRATDRYPQRAWLKYAAPEEAGWSSQKLDEAEAFYDQLDSAAVVVIYDGAVLVQWGDVRRRLMCHSIRKSLLSALYGIHVAEGNIDLTKTLAELDIDDRPPLTDAEKQACIGDLLKSRSGIFHPAAYETPRMQKQRPPRGSHTPGDFFWYNNWDFNALCTIFERQTGTKTFTEFQRRIAEPLQMEDFRLQDTYYHLEKQHSIHPAYPFRMSARDMARLGLLFLRQGTWNGRQIIPENWVQESTASHFRKGDTTPNPQYGYGYLWWRIVDGPLHGLGMYSARGYGGHSIDVLPAADLVFVHRVDTFWDLGKHLRRERKRVEDADRFKLLEMVLQARVAAPKAEPRLIPVGEAPQRPDEIAIDSDRLDRYVGAYQFDKFKLQIDRSQGGLLIGGPGMGKFSLLPRSATEFTIEDLEVPVSMELDEQGSPIRITVETAPGHRLHGRPVEP